MSRQNKHIISRLRWNTVFNSKEQANELQNRLSNWSRQVFEREIPYLLNQFCAEGKLWTIHQLELDLGEIDYDELETSLLKKLKQQLYEALYRLTVNNPTSGENTIQVMDEQVSGIRMLSGFLLHGVIPWQYAAGVKDINQVMHDELAQHADAVMNMLHEIATNRREVRRRMAWQVSEPNIVTIIQQLEPANSNVIVEFANNLALVQEKETVVQAASGEFKKNVWFWVLNYLFTLHGSLFNKKEFLKSSIRQMAAHYNTGYEELLLLIRKLVMELSGSAKFSGFLEVLNILVNEQALRQNYHATTPVGEPTATGEQLKRYFLQQLVAGTVHNRDQWNRDVQRAAQQPWFGEWVQQLQPGTAGWQPLYRLSATSLEALFRVYPSPGNSIMLQQVQFFVAASVAAWLPVTKKELLIALLGEIKKQGLPGDNARTIMETLVRCVAGITRKPVQHIPALLLEAEIPAHEKTPVVVYWRKRMEIYYHTVSPQANHTVTQLYRVLRLWITGSVHKHRQQKAQAQLALLLKTNAAAVIKVLQAQPDKQMVQQFLLQAVTPGLARQAVQHVQPQQARWTVQLHQVFNELRKEPGMATWAAALAEQVYVAGLISSVIAPQRGYAVFFSHLVKQLYTFVPGAVQQQFGLLLNTLFRQRLFPQVSFSVKQQERIEQQYGYTRMVKKISAKKQWVELAGNHTWEQWLQYSEHIQKEGALPGALWEQAPAQRGHAAAYAEELAYVEQCIAAGKTGGVPPGINARLYFAFALKKCVSANARGLLRVFKQHPVTEQRVHFLFRHITVAELARTAAQIGKGRQQAQARTVWSLYEYAIQVARVSAGHELVQQIKTLLYTLLVEEGCTETTFSRLTGNIIQSLARYTRTVEAHIQRAIHRNSTIPVSGVHTKEQQLVATSPPVLWLKKWLVQNDIPQLHPNWAMELLAYCVQQKTAPEWLTGWGSTIPETAWVETVLLYYPATALKYFRNNTIATTQKQRLCTWVSVPAMLHALRYSRSGWENECRLMANFHQVLLNREWNRLPGISFAQILAEKIFTAWVSGNRRIVSPLFIWQELFWELEWVYRVPAKKARALVAKHSATLPAVLQTALNKLLEQDKPEAPRLLHSKPNTASIQMAIKQSLRETPAQTGIEVFNAGMVLLNNYIPMLFDRLKLTEGHRFINEQAQLEAVHYLQYLVTGQETTDEAWLPLNKLMCGLPLSQPVPPGISIPGSAKELINGLFTAIIGYWPAIGDTSADGFRGNWLVRKGLLTEGDEKWDLHVEKRPYDLLIGKSPFSFSVIKFPWMNKPVHVSWPF